MADKRDILVNLLGKETVSAAAGKAGKGLDKLGDAFDATKNDAKRLDAEIGDVEQSLKTLAVQFARTGDQAERLDISKAMRKQQTELRKLSQARGLLGGDGDAFKDGARIGGKLAGGVASGVADAGGAISKAVGNAFGTVPPQAQLAIVGGVVAAATVAAPFVASVLTGAVVGGIGTGAVAAGVALAAGDPAVKAAGTELGATLSSGFRDAAKPFVPETLRAIDTVRSEFLTLRPEIAGIFADGAKYVGPLTNAAVGFVKNVVPGLRDATTEGDSFFSMLERKVPELGTNVGEFFSKLSEHADEGAAAMGTLIDATGSFIDFAGDATVGAIALGNALSDTWEFLKKYGTFDPLAPETEKKFIRIQKSADEGAGGVKRLADEAELLRIKAEAAAGGVDALREAVSRGLSKNLDARQAQRDLEQAIDDGSAALAKNGQTAINHGAALDINSAKGRANADALDRIAREANGAYDEIMATTGSQELANAASDRGRVKFIALAMGMGLSKSAAAVLADQLLRIKDRKVTVTANTAAALAAAQSVVARINNMTARISVSTAADGSFGGPAHSGFGNSTGYAEGGPITGLPGPRGVDSGFIKAANGEHMLTADEVAAAGGHSAIKQWRASLLGGGRSSGGLPAAAGGGGGGVQVVKHVHVIQWPNGQVAAEIVCEGFKAPGHRAVSGLVAGLADAGGSPRALGIGGRWSG